MLVTRTPIERFHRIAAALANRKRTTASFLAEELEVSRKTVERDLEFMRNRLALPIESDVAGHWFSVKIKLCRCCARRVRV